MLKYLMKLRRRKGFTLVELVIVIAILAVLMGCMAAFSGPIQQMVKQTASSADALAANKIIGDYIENRLSFADDIRFLYAIDSSSVTTYITEAFDYMKTRSDTAVNPYAGKAGVMIFHYEEDTEDPTQSKYLIYDYVYDSTASSYASVVLDGSELNESGEVFDTPFYQNSQNIIIAPTDFSTNKVRNSVFMSFEMYSYDFTEDYMVYNADGSVDYTDSACLSDSTLSNYYAYKANPASNPDGADDETYGLGRLAVQKSGATETISFELKNIEIDNFTNPGPDGIPATSDDIQEGVTDNWRAIKEEGQGGNDIMIFYHVPNYS